MTHLFMDPIACDRIFTIAASAAFLIGSGIALILLPKGDREVAVLAAAFGWPKKK